MVIEPLGSLMTIQAQSYSQVKQEQPVNNIESQINIIQPEMFEKKLTTVVETNKSESNDEFKKENNKNFKTKNNNKLKDANSKELSDEEKERIKEIINEANKVLGNTRAAFSYHEELNRIQIKVIDNETNEVIKEIPTEETLDSLAKRIELYKKFNKKNGFLFDQKC